MKRFVILIAICLLLTTGQAWGTIYYVIPDTYNAEMPATPVAAGVTQILAKAGSWPTGKGDCISGVSAIERLFEAPRAAYDQIILSGGVSGVTYAGTALDADSGIDTAGADPDYITMRGANSTDTDGASHKGTVTLTSGGVANEVIYFSNPGNRISDLEIIQPDAENAIVFDSTCGTQCSAENLKIWHPTGRYSGQHAVLIYGCGSGVSRVRIYNSCGNAFVLQGTGDNDAPYVHYSSAVSSAGVGVWVTTGSGVSIWNVTSLGAGTYPLYLDSGEAPASGTSIVNCVFGIPDCDNPVISSGVATVYMVDATTRAAFDKTHVIGSARGVDDGYIFGGTKSEFITGNTQFGAPTFLTGRRKGIIAPSIDDTIRYQEALDLSVIADEFGYKISWYASADSFKSSDTYINAGVSLISRGHEVGVHSASHPDLGTIAQGSIQYMGGGAATYTVNTGASTFTISGPGGADTHIIDMTGVTIGQVFALIDAKANWNAGITNTGVGAGRSIAGVLADVVGADCSTGVSATVSVDPNRFWAVEIGRAKADIEAALLTKGVSYTIRSMAYPYGGNITEPLMVAVQQYGLLGARTTTLNRTRTHSTAARLENLSIYEIDGTGVEGLFNGNPTGGVTREATDAFLENARFVGVIWSPYFHTWSELDQATWRIIFEECAKFSDIHVITMGDAFEHIRGTKTGILPASTSDSGASVWAVQWQNDLTWEPKLAKDSILRDTGTNDRNQDGAADAWVTTDIDGAPVPMFGTADIGAYEFYYFYNYGGAVRGNTGIYPTVAAAMRNYPDSRIVFYSTNGGRAEAIIRDPVSSGKSTVTSLINQTSGYSNSYITRVQILRHVNPREMRRNRGGPWKVVWDSAMN